MKATIHKLCFGMILCMATLYSGSANGQIDYFENFDDEGHKWTTLDFYTADAGVCGVYNAFRANPVNDAGVTVPVETVSPSLGVSNGEEVRLSYSYKLMDYDAVLPYTAVDDQDWGQITVEYGPTNNGPWTAIDVVTPFDHVASTNCTTRTVNFIPEIDEEVYLRVVADAGTSLGVNYFIDIDDISAYQATMTIDPIVERRELEVHPNPVRDIVVLEYPGYITDVVVFNTAGQAVVVEDMDNDFKRLNMEGLATGHYIFRIATDDTQVWTVNIVKD